MPLHDHAERIADKNRIDTRFVEDLTPGKIISGDHRQAAPFGFRGHKAGDRHWPT